MRHVHIRGILALIWLAAAIFRGVSGSPERALIQALLRCMCRRIGQAADNLDLLVKGLL